MNMSFDGYADLIRQISAIRQADHARHTTTRQTAAGLHADLDRLTARHTNQATHLHQLAHTLRLPPPPPSPPPPSAAPAASPAADPQQALHHAAQAIDAADAAARQAEDTAARPILLPDLTPTARNTLIYTGCAAAGWLLQCGLLLAAPQTSFAVLAWSLCGLPAVAFFAGYLTIATVGQPRIHHQPQQQRHVGLGGVICFAGMPLAWLALVAAFTMLRA